MVYQTEKQLKEHGEKVPADVRGNIENALNGLKDALKSDDGDRIKKSMENLTQIQHKLAEEIYKSTAGAAAADAGMGGAGPAPEAQSDRPAGEAKKDDDVIDAEYEVKDNK